MREEKEAAEVVITAIPCTMFVPVCTWSISHVNYTYGMQFSF